MSKPRAYLKATIDIQERFFAVLDELIAYGVIESHYRYCTDHGINRRNFQTQHKERSRGYFQCGWIVPLVSDHHVSARWLLTGIGSRYTKAVICNSSASAAAADGNAHADNTLQ